VPNGLGAALWRQF